MPHFDQGAFQAVLASHLAAQAIAIHRRSELLNEQPKKQLNCTTIGRVRKTMREVYKELGPKMFRRSFRMKYTTFNLLFSKVKPKLMQVMKKDTMQQSRNHAVNGMIPLPVRLGCALRFWAGGDAYDLMLVFGISYCEVFRYVDFLLDAINKTHSLRIEFPTDHKKQKDIAKEFESKSDVRFDNCVGCVDGLLIWIHMPSKSECEEIQVGQTKFVCGRKSKFGLNMQAICDAKRRFLDISILYGASASDMLAFETSPIRVQMDRPGFLAEGLCLYGDNAYVNRSFMASPDPTGSGIGVQDSYNFFHSQLRINIECAFGMLVNRWGFLRKKAPKNYSIKKTIATVSCLCSLHNFLIDQRCTTPDANTAADALSLAIEGAVPMERATNGERVPGQLLQAGNHFDDDPQYTVRKTIYQTHNGRALPRTAMIAHVANKGMSRPVRNIERNGRR